MKGKALSDPSNHVEWANGFRSNMPDWPTARHCAAVDLLLNACQSARTMLLTFERPGAVSFHEAYDRERFDQTIRQVQDALDAATGASSVRPLETPLDVLRYHVSGAIERGEKIAIVSKPFPKPPGV